MSQQDDLAIKLKLEKKEGALSDSQVSAKYSSLRLVPNSSPFVLDKAETEAAVLESLSFSVPSISPPPPLFSFSSSRNSGGEKEPNRIKSSGSFSRTQDMTRETAAPEVWKEDAEMAGVLWPLARESAVQLRRWECVFVIFEEVVTQMAMGC